MLVVRYLRDNLVACCDEHNVYVVDTWTGEHKHVLPVLESPPSLWIHHRTMCRLRSPMFIHCINTNQGHLTVSVKDKNIRVWSISSQECLSISFNKFLGFPHSEEIVFIGSLLDGRMVTISKDRAMFVWSLDLIPTQVLDAVHDRFASIEADMWVKIYSRGVLIRFGDKFVCWRVDNPANMHPALNLGIRVCCELSDDVFICLDSDQRLHLVNTATMEPTIQLNAAVSNIWCDSCHVFVSQQENIKVYQQSLLQWPSARDDHLMRKYLLQSVVCKQCSSHVTSVLYCNTEMIATTCDLGNAIRIWNVSNGSWKDINHQTDLMAKYFVLQSSAIDGFCLGVLEGATYKDSYQMVHYQQNDSIDFAANLEGTAALKIGGTVYVCKYASGLEHSTPSMTVPCGRPNSVECFKFCLTAFKPCGASVSLVGVLDLSHYIVEVHGVGKWNLTASGLLVQKEEFFLQYWNGKDWNVSYKWEHDQC